jgi:carboxyl-terminal processing protease
MKTLINGIALLILSGLSLSAMAGSSIQGIGIALADSKDEFIVHEVFSGSPAERGGVHVNDIITAVDGRPVDGKPLKQVVKMIRGPSGSHVSVTLSDGAGHLRDAQMIREKFVIQTDEPTDDQMEGSN